ncbi:MAG: hypothetical protein JW761_08045 [Prolixibacteraceae bacterium]|nr:hypothetical protein [Prolixibacteraceae bacterium]
MNSKLKRDQIPPMQARNWRKNFKEEKEKTFNLLVPKIILEKETYLKLAGENENRVRIYLALEEEKKSGKNVLCAYAVSAFLLGSGDVYADYETPVYKLEKKNINFSNNTGSVIESIRRFRKWRAGEIDAEDENAKVRQYIYPNAYLLTKFELHEIFISQNRTEAEIDFGISKIMDAMIYPAPSEMRSENDDMEVFDGTGLCPPYCDERSIYNT